MGNFFTELKRRNVTRVAFVYVLVSWLLVQVADTVFPALHLPEWTITLVTALLLLGLPVALVFAWAFELTPDGIKRDSEVDRSQSIAHRTGRKLDFAIIGVLVVAVVYFAATHDWSEGLGGSTGANDNSIAVLPFVDMSAAGDQEYFADGIAEELLNVLTRMPGVEVASRTSSFRFKGKDVDIPTVAKALRVRYVLEGSVRKAGDEVRVTAQLIEAASDRHLWSDSYDRTLEDIFAVQDEIALNIVNALEIHLGVGEAEQVLADSRPTENLEAYDLYYQGRHLWRLRGSVDISESISYFEKALELDPDFARAWSALAAAQVVQMSVTNEDEVEAVVSAAKRAIALDDTLAEPYAVLATVANERFQWAEALRLFREAIKRDPKEISTRQWLGNLLVEVGHIDAAVEEVRMAHELDRTSMIIAGYYMLTLVGAGEYEEFYEIARSARSMGFYPEITLHCLYHADIETGNRERAADRVRSYIDEHEKGLYGTIWGPPDHEPRFYEMLADLIMDPGAWSFEELWSLESAHNNPKPDRRFDVIIQYAYLTGDADVLMNNLPPEMFGNVQIAGPLLYQQFFVGFPAFRRHPDYPAFTERFGLVEFWREHGWPDYCEPVGDSFECV
ncbi:MAG: hypothetical protein E2O56_07190 [Gammaproteobacteria bacterium]|nr:MAG: hypothetical protein E2O56_07190 [Gammaproteobacteria bacterium]